MGFCSQKCCAITGMIIFSLLLVLSGIIFIVVDPVLQAGLEEEFIVSSPDSPRFTFWACKFNMFNEGICADPHDKVPFYEKYFFFNITNLDEVLAGGNIKVEEMGPYTYQADFEKYDIEFLNDGEIVEYSIKNTYYFSPENSCEGCTEEDEYLSVNAGYLGAVNVAGGEQVLILGLGGPVIGELLNKITDTYIAYLIERDGLEASIAKCKAIDPECETPFDMALVQWGYYAKSFVPANRKYGLENVAVNEWDPVLFPNGPAEYSVNQVTGVYPAAPLNITQCKMLLYGQKGIVEGPLYALELLQSVNSTDLEEIWGLTPSDVGSFGLYLLALGGEGGYNEEVFKKVTVLQGGGGLFSLRKVHQWLWFFHDPLLLYMQPKDPQTAVRYNDTSVEDARSYKPGKWAIKTGKNSPKDVANVTMWNGTYEMDFWAQPVPIHGNNQEGQFFFVNFNGRGKLPSPLEEYDVFSPDHGRTVYLADIGQTVKTPGGIKLHRTIMTNETYLADPLYFNDYEGFIYGAFHMDPPFRKRIDFTASVPLYFSQPRFWPFSNNLTEKIEYINVEPNLEDCATIVDIEPISGNGLGAFKRLQINFFVEGNFGKYHPNVTQGVMYPVMYLQQDVVVTEELEEEWKSELGFVLDFLRYFFIIGLAVGSLGFVISLFALVRASRRDSGYQTIN